MLKALAVVAGVLGLVGSASAQTWPARPITMVIPFAAGGPTDVLGRVMGERMSQILGQQVVIENVGGAGGGTGSQRVARAEPDGYTFVLGTVGTHAQNQTLYKKPLYSAATDFQPVALIAEVPLILITRKDLPANTSVAKAASRDLKALRGIVGLRWRPASCPLNAARTTVRYRKASIPRRSAARGCTVRSWAWPPFRAAAHSSPRP